MKRQIDYSDIVTLVALQQQQQQQQESVVTMAAALLLQQQQQQQQQQLVVPQLISQLLPPNKRQRTMDQYSKDVNQQLRQEIELRASILAIQQQQRQLRPTAPFVPYWRQQEHQTGSGRALLPASAIRPINNVISNNPLTTSSAPQPEIRSITPTSSSSGSSSDGTTTSGRYREYQFDSWKDKLNELKEYRMQHGNCHVPSHHASLATWVKRQRYQYKLLRENKRSTLSEERVRILNDVQFIWNSHEAVWETRLHELCAYQHLHGNCVVPSTYKANAKLAVWVKRQRRQYKLYQDGKQSCLTKERITKLDRLGFSWDCRVEKQEEVSRPAAGSLQHNSEPKSRKTADRNTTVSFTAANGAQEPVDQEARLRCEFLSFSRFQCRS